MTKAPNSVHDNLAFHSTAVQRRALCASRAAAHRPTICMQNVAGVGLRALSQK